ncbi:MAG: hypothetical protein ACI8S6_002411 [Myxococcota bacterium]|jgi:hypothetical protein
MISILLLALSCASTPSEAPAPLIINAPSGVVSGGGCSQTGCALDAPHTTMDDTEFVGLLDEWSTEPLGESTLALDTLLFDAERSTALLSVHGDRLTAERRAFLDRELARTEVVVEMRLVDEEGTIRGWLSSEGFSLRDKQHFAFADTGSLGWLETGGKVKRVGLGHLWSRW